MTPGIDVCLAMTCILIDLYIDLEHSSLDVIGAFDCPEVRSVEFLLSSFSLAMIVRS